MMAIERTTATGRASLHKACRGRRTSRKNSQDDEFAALIATGDGSEPIVIFNEGGGLEVSPDGDVQVVGSPIRRP